MTAKNRRDRIRGCLFGGAVGDALGYPIEFRSEQYIFAAYAPDGLQEYCLDPFSRKALISDDTQMTLFTAEGILRGGKDPRTGIREAYQDWYDTQTKYFQPGTGTSGKKGRRLLDVPQLYDDRAPGNTCMSALRRKDEIGTIEAPLNNSKGCGGIMRVAPIALKAFPGASAEEIDRLAADASAFTHGHSLGYMPSAVLVHILHRIVSSEEPAALETLINEARNTVCGMFEGNPHLQELTSIIDLAVHLSQNDRSDLENINEIGEGWVAEETLGIALYCALRHRDDFSKGVIAAVNHKGDSDSTGAVTGNILGALLGYEAIDEKWKKDLELADLILEMADELAE